MGFGAEHPADPLLLEGGAGATVVPFHQELPDIVAGGGFATGAGLRNRSLTFHYPNNLLSSFEFLEAQPDPKAASRRNKPLRSNNERLDVDDEMDVNIQ